MRSKFKSVFALATAAAVMFGGFTAANAATVTVAGVSGVWTSTDPANPPGLAGIGTDSVSWGVPVGGQKSGYSFVGAAAGQIETGVDFDLGTFTHNNFVIQRGTSINGAALGVVVNLVIGGVAQAVNAAFTFNHWETDNDPGRRNACANGAANGSGVNAGGCADRVTILDNAASQEKFVIDGFEYILEITGFTRAGELFSAFWTEEKKANSAILSARFVLVGPTGGGGGGGEEPGGPTPSPVPLPAAGWMMLAALGALAASRARKKV